MPYHQERPATDEEMRRYHDEVRRALKAEAGKPTQWDVAWREGYAAALDAVLGVGTRRAHQLAVQYWRPAQSSRLVRWLLRRLIPRGQP
jgi:hypothetical protein